MFKHQLLSLRSIYVFLLANSNVVARFLSFSVSHALQHSKTSVKYEYETPQTLTSSTFSRERVTGNNFYASTIVKCWAEHKCVSSLCVFIPWRKFFKIFLPCHTLSLSLFSFFYSLYRSLSFFTLENALLSKFQIDFSYRNFSRLINNFFV